MTKLDLGRLERVDLREVWASESGDFTPWLALPENIALLGETLGLDLEVEAQEKDVGPFRADIFCRHTATNDAVLIENQLERTDHGHLGQLLTYAAGLKAATIIWVAAAFTDEHRAALDWLNEITGERFQFFGLEVEAWRIGQSMPAPKFNIVSKPNDWSREVTTRVERELSPVKRMQLDFWTGFREYAERHAKRFRPLNPMPQTWMPIAIGRVGFNLAAVASTWNSVTKNADSHELRAEFVITHELGAEALARLLQQRQDIERELGEALEWYSAEGVKQRRVYLRRDADLDNKAHWPEYFAWLTERVDRLHAAFQGRVKALDLDAQGGDAVPMEGRTA